MQFDFDILIKSLIFARKITQLVFPFSKRYFSIKKNHSIQLYV
jgi:hypothetical protein